MKCDSKSQSIKHSDVEYLSTSVFATIRIQKAASDGFSQSLLDELGKCLIIGDKTRLVRIKSCKDLYLVAIPGR